MYKLLLILIFGSFISFNTSAYAQIKPMQTQQDTMTIQQYGEKIANMLLQSDWAGIVNEIYPIKLPKEWKEMVKPIFAAYFGYKMKVEIISFNELPDHQLRWLKTAPKQALKHTTQAIRLSYSHSSGNGKNTGKLELAVYRHDGKFSILMVGGE